MYETTSQIIFELQQSGDSRSHLLALQMANLRSKPGDWQVDVKFRSKGVLQATASGLLLVPPEDVLALVTDRAGDEVFRVVQRTILPPSPNGAQRVEVVNKAAIRILAWKFWTRNFVAYEITATDRAAPSQDPCSDNSSKTPAGGNSGCSACSGENDVTGQRKVSFQLLSSNMLHSLSGTWRLEPIKIHHSAFHPVTCSRFESSSSMPLNKTAAVPELHHRLSMLAVDSNIAHSMLSADKDALGGTPAASISSNSSSSITAVSGRGFTPDADGNITATLVQYEQLAQPKGLPPGVRFVPGMSDAVRMTIGREVRQMLDKIKYAADLELKLGVTPQEALTQMTHHLQQTEGSFKQLQKQLAENTAAAAMEAAAATATSSNGSSSSSSRNSRRRHVGARSIVESEEGQQVAQLEVSPLQLPGV